jgi:hypothetical protein
MNCDTCNHWLEELHDGEPMAVTFICSVHGQITFDNRSICQQTIHYNQPTTEPIPSGLRNTLSAPRNPLARCQHKIEQLGNAHQCILQADHAAFHRYEMGRI